MSATRAATPHARRVGWRWLAELLIAATVSHWAVREIMQFIDAHRVIDQSDEV